MQESTQLQSHDVSTLVGPTRISIRGPVLRSIGVSNPYGRDSPCSWTSDHGGKWLCDMARCHGITQSHEVIRNFLCRASSSASDLPFSVSEYKG